MAIKHLMLTKPVKITILSYTNISISVLFHKIIGSIISHSFEPGV